MAPAELGALLALTGLWQVWFYISWDGWPFTRLTRRRTRLLAGNVVVVGAGIISYLLANAAGIAAVTVIAAAGSFIAAALLLGLLFDGWLPGSPTPSLKRPITIVVDLVAAAILYAALNAYAHHLHWTSPTQANGSLARHAQRNTRSASSSTSPSVSGGHSVTPTTTRVGRERADASDLLRGPVTKPAA